MYTLIVRAGFDAAHHIPGHSGRCAEVHGHSYRVECEFVGGETLDELGMVHDFGDLRRRLVAVLPDHRDLNDVMDVIPTAENIAAWLYARLAADGLPISSVTVWETEHYGCRYSPAGQAKR